MAGRYWSVKSVYSQTGEFIDAYVYGRFFLEKPHDRHCSDTGRIIFFNWFETFEKASAYLFDVKEGGRKWRQGF
jgi:hypothetical protein